MSKKQEFNPDYCIHPIETILEQIIYCIANELDYILTTESEKYIKDCLYLRDTNQVITTKLTIGTAIDIESGIGICSNFLLENNESYKKFYGIGVGK